MRQERHYFIALPVSSEQLVNIAERLPLTDHFRNIYTIEEYHLTLRFFGPLTEEDRKSWEQRLQMIARTTDPFVLRFDRMIAFGKEDRPRVVGFGTESDVLRRLVQQIDVTPTKPFVPHVTIAKKWRKETAGWTKKSFEPIDWLVQELVLFEVRPEASPRYEPVYRIQLGKEE